MPSPRVFVLFSGKRKAGKDFCAEQLRQRLQIRWKIAVVGVSHSLKKEYAESHGLDYDELLSSNDYKERFRRDMIEWGENIRRQDEAYFVRRALSSVKDDVRVFIMSDCRRESDLRCLKDERRITVRVEACEASRSRRGFVFSAGIDDAESECGLDGWADWDVVIDNSSEDCKQVNEALAKIEMNIENYLRD